MNSMCAMLRDLVFEVLAVGRVLGGLPRPLDEAGIDCVALQYEAQKLTGNVQLLVAKEGA